MNLRSLSIHAAFVLLPIALFAQTPAASPTLYAESESPTVFSSSNVPDAHAELAAGAQSTTAVAAPAPSSGRSLPFSGVGIGVNFGLGGIGFEVATPLLPRHLNLRGEGSFLSYTPSTITTSGNLNINGTIKFQNAAAMVDWFPFHGVFRLSGGMTLYNDTGLTANLAVPPGKSVTLGSVTYYSDPNVGGNPLSGNGAFTFGGNKVVPRTTLGFGNMLPKKGHFRFEMEAGVQYFSAPTVALAFSGNGCPAANSPEIECGPVNQTDVQNEQTKLQNDLYDLKFYPILSFGLTYRIH